MAIINNQNAPDYTGASAQKYTDAYTNRPEDAGNLEGIQGLLSKIGMAPGIGEPADLLNALLYGIQGEGKQAGLSALSMLPFLGGAIKPIRKFSKSGIVESMKRKGSAGSVAVKKAGTEDKTLSELSKIYDKPFKELEDYTENFIPEEGGNYFKNLLDDLFESFKGKEF